MVAPVALPRWPVEQYLALERGSDVRHEYLDGIVCARAGGSQRHSALCGPIGGLLFAALRGGPCRVYTSDLKVRVGPTRYFYPDVSVGCEAGAPSAEADWLAAPGLVVEVLSDSTAAYDRGDKRLAYQALPSLRHLLLVETERRLVEVHRRAEGGLWTVRQFGAGEVIELPDPGARLAVDDIYAGIALD